MAKKKPIQQPSQEDILRSSLNYHKDLIADVWWVLTDITSYDLKPEPYLRLVNYMLGDIACQRYEEKEAQENKNDK